MLAKTSPVKHMEMLDYRRLDSPVGPLLLGISHRGLKLLEFDRGTRSATPGMSSDAGKGAMTETADRYICQLQEYFHGQRRSFDFPLDLCGTPFQMRCWRALLEIPYGQTRSYAEIARAVGSPRGFRAVGMANHQNPIAIVVPCHRVLASDGTLCGYGGGMEVKRKLLELERAGLAAQPVKINS